MLRFTVLWATVLLLTSCDQSANRVSTLWTNVPEMASAAEAFNASQREWQLLVEYHEDPATLVANSAAKADLVVGRHLTSSEIKDALAGLDFLFDGGPLAKAAFYQHALDAGLQGDRIKLLPISFDLPVLLFSRTRQPDLPGFSVSLAQLKELNASFDALPAPKDFRRQAFSPRWGGFGLTFLHWYGESFHEGFQADLAWDTSALRDGLRLYQGWPSPGWTQTAEFQRKYLQTEVAPTLTSGRIQFYPSTLASFLNRPWRERQDLDFRFLAQNSRVVATDSTVWAGIPSRSVTRGAAEHFLAWFFQNDTQRRLIERTRWEDDRTFGLAQGLSSLVASNNEALVASEPELVGRLPAADEISFWQATPTEWPQLKTAVLQPWLNTADGSEASLRSALERYRAQGTRH